MTWMRQGYTRLASRNRVLMGLLLAPLVPFVHFMVLSAMAPGRDASVFWVAAAVVAGKLCYVLCTVVYLSLLARPAVTEPTFVLWGGLTIGAVLATGLLGASAFWDSGWRIWPISLPGWSSGGLTTLVFWGIAVRRNGLGG